MSLAFAVIGPGRIADRQLVPALKQVPGAHLWSVLSRDPARGSAFAARHGAAGHNPAPATLEEMLKDDKLDAVIIASPDRLHAEQAVAAAEAGKHVLVEKPMATDLAEAKRMVDAAVAHDVQLGVAYHLRWHAGLRTLADKARRGEFGRLRHVRAQWTWKAEDSSNWRADEEVGRWWSLGGVGTHCLDLVRWVLVPNAGEVVDIQSTISREVFGGPHDESALLILRFESGATAEVYCSVLHESPNRLEIYGSRGWAIANDTFGVRGAGSIHIGRHNMEYRPFNPYVGEIADFVAAIRHGRPPEVDGIEGLRNVDLLLRAISG